MRGVVRPVACGVGAAWVVLALGGCGDRDDRDSATPSPEGPPGLVGEVTEVDGSTGGGALLVEEQPGVDAGGRKAWIGVDGVAIVGPDGEADPRADNPATLIGETVSVWTTICRESYPEQCDAERIVVG